MTATYPLLWPSNWPRTAHRLRAPFSTKGDDALWHLEDNVRLIGGRNLIVSTNLPIARYLDKPKWSEKPPADPGVAIYFDLDGEEVCMPCDRWDRVVDNVRAIGKTVEALRGIERWGAKEMVRAAFTGFAALPVGGTEHWSDVLGVAPTATRAEIDTAYKRLLKQVHPDVGGDHERFHAVQAAYQQATAAGAIA